MTDFLNKLKKDLPDPWWRLNNLYYILDDQGQQILFEPMKRKVQRDLYLKDHPRQLVLKSRQHGISTYYCLLFLDAVLFNPNSQAIIIAHSLESAGAFLLKMKYAYNSIRIPQLREHIKLELCSASKMSFSNGSQIRVITSARSTTVQYLHISELGKIAAVRPDKALEIISGCLPAVPANGRISIESTAEGSEGIFYDLCKQVFETPIDSITELDFKPYFFPWYLKEECSLDTQIVIVSELQEYFQELELKHKVKLSEQQKWWYVKTYEVLQDSMLKEYPSTRDECFENAVIGVFYQKQMFKLRLENRHRNILYDDSLYVNTAWDIGISDSMAITFYQLEGDKIKVIDYYENNEYDISHYLSILKDKPYRYNKHFVPHDFGKRDVLTGKSRLERAKADYGMNFTLIPISKSVIEDINLVRRNFHRIYIVQEKCDRLIKCLDNYRKEFDSKRGIFRDKPLHNEYSDGADSFRYMILSLDYLETKKIDFNNLTTPVYNNTPGGWMR